MPAQKGSQSFPKTRRLLKPPEFMALRQQGHRQDCGAVILWWRPNQLGYARLGLAVSRKVGKSHIRNLLKRRCREVFRQTPDLPAVDVMVMARPQAARLTWPQLSELWAKAWLRIGQRLNRPAG